MIKLPGAVLACLLFAWTLALPLPTPAYGMHAKRATTPAALLSGNKAWEEFNDGGVDLAPSATTSKSKGVASFKKSAVSNDATPSKKRLTTSTPQERGGTPTPGPEGNTGSTSGNPHQSNGAASKQNDRSEKGDSAKTPLDGSGETPSTAGGKATPTNPSDDGSSNNGGGGGSSDSDSKNTKSNEPTPFNGSGSDSQSTTTSSTVIPAGTGTSNRAASNSTVAGGGDSNEANGSVEVRNLPQLQLPDPKDKAMAAILSNARRNRAAVIGFLAAVIVVFAFALAIWVYRRRNQAKRAADPDGTQRTAKKEAKAQSRAAKQSRKDEHKRYVDDKHRHVNEVKSYKRRVEEEKQRQRKDQKAHTLAEKESQKTQQQSQNQSQQQSQKPSVNTKASASTRHLRPTFTSAQTQYIRSMGPAIVGRFSSRKRATVAAVQAMRSVRGKR